MKFRLLLAAFLLGPVACATEAKPAVDFLQFNPDEKPFGQADAEKLASAEFHRLHGDCGMTIFKERRFEMWIFETRVGYAGVPGPDIVVISTRPSVPEVAGTVSRLRLRDMLEPIPARAAAPVSPWSD